MLPERSIGGPDRGFGLGAWAEVVLGSIYPPVCAVCHQQRADRHRGYVCDTCQNGVHRITEPCCRRCGIPFEGRIIGSQTCTACRRDSWAWDEARAAVVAEGIAFVAASPPVRGRPNAYEWYYATLASFHAGGPQWEAWNARLLAT